jgi:hypothetical protein
MLRAKFQIGYPTQISVVRAVHVLTTQNKECPTPPACGVTQAYSERNSLPFPFVPVEIADDDLRKTGMPTFCVENIRSHAGDRNRGRAMG